MINGENEENIGMTDSQPSACTTSSTSTVDFHPHTCSLGVLPYPHSSIVRSGRRSLVSTPCSLSCMFSPVDSSTPIQLASVFRERCKCLSPSTQLHFLTLYYTTYVPFYHSFYLCSQPCTFFKSVTLSSALALPM